MNRTVLGAASMAIASLALVSAQSNGRGETSASAPRPGPVSAADGSAERAVLDRYCVGCHNAKLKTANLLLDQLDLGQLAEHAEIGEKVVRKLRAGLMPPAGMRRPDPATLESLIRWMEDELDRSAGHPPSGAGPSPAQPHRIRQRRFAICWRSTWTRRSSCRPTIRRTGSTIIAGALTMSPALMEAYLSAAGKISRLAIGDVSAPTQAVFDVPPTRRRTITSRACRSARAAAC